MNIPENVKNLITALEECGYRAYAVGGCVRDSLQGKAPKDWDICTSARPEQVKEVFKNDKVFDTGIKHGAVTLVRKESYEITTFRTDGEYSDCRRPESVKFIGSVEQDLARRDFTVNAMAYNPREGLIDPFGGRYDLEKKILRTVGEPEKRFSEDALRIMRGLRFSVSLGFEIEEETAAAMLSHRELLKNVSAERVCAELMKTLVSGCVKRQLLRFREIIAEIIPEIRPCFGFEQKTRHHCFDVYEHILTAVDNYDGDDVSIKTALLLHDIAKPKMYRFYAGSAHFKGHPAAGAKMAADILKRLKFDNKTAQSVLALIKYHDVRLKGGMPQILKLIRLIGEENMARLFPVMYADALAQSDYELQEKLELIRAGEKNFRLALEKGMCCRLSDLKIRGGDVMELGFRGSGIGAALNFALNGVMNGKVENERENLLSYIKGFPRL